MTPRILITGSEGLVGRALGRALTEQGYAVVGIDLRGTGPARGDVRDRGAVAAAMRACNGVVHLAAVSRVIWGERDPALCRATNIDGTRNVLDAAASSSRAAAPRPWVLFSSSREVYGQPASLPVAEDAPLAPMNIYGRCKLAGEELMLAARQRGLVTAIARLSNVYGDTRDHADRVIPAFARAAALGQPLRVEGSEHTFDFTHLDDTVRGLVAIIKLLDRGVRDLAPIHLLPGVPTTLGELAALAVELAATDAPIVEAPPRCFDVSRFYGDPRRARELLGWQARVPLRQGLGQLIRDFQAA
jgi:nucleoside-diphosphate-sugar epimerase